MILDSTFNKVLYYPVNKLFEKAFNYLASSDLASLPDGHHSIEDGIDLVIVESELKMPQDAILEAHDKCIFIEWVISGKEGFLWQDRGQCVSVFKQMDPAKDLICYNDLPAMHGVLCPGQFAVFFPGDAYATSIHSMTMGGPRARRAMVKIRL